MPRDFDKEEFLPLDGGETPFFSKEESAPTIIPEENALFFVDLQGFEGPLDLMLDLARREKLDLRLISILALADEYLRFIDEVRHLKLEVAGDYLVMAAWLTYLKSRLLLPKRQTEDNAPSGQELAEALAHKLRRLQAARQAGEWFAGRLQEAGLTQERGGTEPVVSDKRIAWQVHVHELLTAYAAIRGKHGRASYALTPRVHTLSIPDARAKLEAFFAKQEQYNETQTSWHDLMDIFEVLKKQNSSKQQGLKPASFWASGLVAALELVRERRLDLKQNQAFSPLFVRGLLGGAVRPPSKKAGEKGLLSASTSLASLDFVKKGKKSKAPKKPKKQLKSTKI